MTAIRLLPFALALSLIACGPADDGHSVSSTDTETKAASAKAEKPATTSTNWQCGDLLVTTRFDDKSLESMTLQVSDHELVLKTIAAEDGARFADADGNEFWSRPGKVNLTLAGKPVASCKKSRDVSL